MASPLYSNNFFSDVPAAGSPVTIGTVPAGYVWVLRDMHAVNISGEYSGLQGFLLYTGAGVYLWTVISPFAMSCVDYHWQGRMVLEPGTELQIIAYDSRWHFHFSGYVLTLP